MKKSFLIISLLLYNTFISAQTTIGINAGANLSTVFWREATGAKNVKVKMNPGFHAGPVITIPVNIYNKELNIQTGVFYTLKGFEERYENDNYGKGTLIVTPRYFEIPLNFLFKLNQEKPGFYVGAGAYVALGIGGNWTIEYTGGRDAGSIEFVDIDKQDPNDDKFNYGKKIDMGVNGIFGYEITRLINIQLAGQLGLKDIAPDKSGNMTFESFRNTGISLSAIFTLR